MVEDMSRLREEFDQIPSSWATYDASSPVVCGFYLSELTELREHLNRTALSIHDILETLENFQP